MRMKAVLCGGFLVLAWCGLALSASYTVNTNQAGEDVLTRAIQPGGAHVGLTKTQVLQRATNDFLRRLNVDQVSEDTRELDSKLVVSTTVDEAVVALNAGITPPTVTPIAPQTHTVNQTVEIPLAATNAYNLPAVFVLLTGPPGIVVGTNEAGVPVLKGTLTTAGTYNNTRVRSYIYRDVFGETIVNWTVNP